MPKGPGTGRGLVSPLITPIPENLKCLLCIRALIYEKYEKPSMTLLPESLKSRTSSNWDFHLITDFKLIIIPAMLFFTVLGFTKAPPKLKNTGLAQEVISICCSLLNVGTIPQPQ